MAHKVFCILVSSRLAPTRLLPQGPRCFADAIQRAGAIPLPVIEQGHGRKVYPADYVGCQPRYQNTVQLPDTGIMEQNGHWALATPPRL